MNCLIASLHTSINEFVRFLVVFKTILNNALVCFFFFCFVYIGYTFFQTAVLGKSTFKNSKSNIKLIEQSVHCESSS